MKFQQFFAQSPTSFHTTQLMAKELKGFTQLDENKPFKLKAGGRYFIRREGSLIAFRLPTKEAKKAIILASHTDSPSFKVRANGHTVEGHSLIPTEVYGGPHIPSWMGQDVCLAGQIVTDKGAKLVHLTDQATLFPNAPIHLDHSPNSEGFKVDKQQHLRLLGVKIPKAISHDLFVVPCEPIRELANGVISGYRIDNLASVFATFEAIKGAKEKTNMLQIALFWDHEEIGSGSEMGAASPFFLDTLKRICGNDEAYYCLKNQSFALSLDAAHAFHPNYPQLYDRENAPHMGKGIAIKLNANRRYATSATSEARLIKMMKKAKVKHQLYINHSNQRCGSTIGHIFASQTGIETVDLGLPILGMHSIREQMDRKDFSDLCQLAKASFNE